MPSFLSIGRDKGDRNFLCGKLIHERDQRRQQLQLQPENYTIPTHASDSAVVSIGMKAPLHLLVSVLGPLQPARLCHLVQLRVDRGRGLIDLCNHIFGAKLIW